VPSPVQGAAAFLGHPTGAGRAILAGMDRKRLQREIEEAERELEAATRLSEVNAAARKLQRARAELKRLEAERPKRPSCGPGSAGAAS
jgi:hypothetical protein